jgi:hypothetical protein
MSELGIIQWLVVSAVLFVVPFWRIAKRAGFKPALAFLAIIPGGILVLIWIIAFARWPAFPKGEIIDVAGGASSGS